MFRAAHTNVCLEKKNPLYALSGCSILKDSCRNYKECCYAIENPSVHTITCQVLFLSVSELYIFDFLSMTFI